MKREIILRTALRMFADKGFAATSSAALAKEAKVAEGTIFRHFTGKEAIFSEILANLHQKVRSEFEASVEAEHPESGLAAIKFAIADFMDFADANRDYMSIFFCEAPTRYIEQQSEVFVEISKIYEYINGFFAGQIKRGQDDGSIRDGVDIDVMPALITCSVIGLARARHFGLADKSRLFIGQFVENTERILK